MPSVPFQCPPAKSHPTSPTQIQLRLSSSLFSLQPTFPFRLHILILQRYSCIQYLAQFAHCAFNDRHVFYLALSTLLTEIASQGLIPFSTLASPAQTLFPQLILFRNAFSPQFLTLEDDRLAFRKLLSLRSPAAWSVSLDDYPLRLLSRSHLQPSESDIFLPLQGIQR